MFVDRRKEKRTPTLGSFVEVYVSSDGARPRADALASNVSNSGTCIFSFHRFDEGLEVRVSGRPLGKDSRQATVKWCNQISDGFFRAGLSLG